MARKSARDFHVESTREPYELDLAAPPEGHIGFVTFLDPNMLSTGSAFDLAVESDPEVQLRSLLSAEDYDLWWEEWREVPVASTTKLLDDVQRHYGVDPGKPRR